MTGGESGQVVALEESVSQSGCSVGGDSVPLPGPHPCKRKMIAVPECHLAATWPMTLVQAQEDGTRTRGGERRWPALSESPQHPGGDSSLP